MEEPTFESISRAIRSILDDRDNGKTICPSEVARFLNPDDWRSIMGAVREAGWRLADEGIIVVTQKGERVGKDCRGPIRYRKAH